MPESITTTSSHAPHQSCVSTPSGRAPSLSSSSSLSSASSSTSSPPFSSSLSSSSSIGPYDRPPPSPLATAASSTYTNSDDPPDLVEVGGAWDLLLSVDIRREFLRSIKGVSQVSRRAHALYLREAFDSLYLALSQSMSAAGSSSSSVPAVITTRAKLGEMILSHKSIFLSIYPHHKHKQGKGALRHLLNYVGGGLDLMNASMTSRDIFRKKVNDEGTSLVRPRKQHPLASSPATHPPLLPSPAASTRREGEGGGEYRHIIDNPHLQQVLSPSNLHTCVLYIRNVTSNPFSWPAVEEFEAWYKMSRACSSRQAMECRTTMLRYLTLWSFLCGVNLTSLRPQFYLQTRHQIQSQLTSLQQHISNPLCEMQERSFWGLFQDFLVSNGAGALVVIPSHQQRSSSLPPQGYTVNKLMPSPPYGDRPGVAPFLPSLDDHRSSSAIPAAVGLESEEKEEEGGKEEGRGSHNCSSSSSSSNNNNSPWALRDLFQCWSQNRQGWAPDLAKAEADAITRYLPQWSKLIFVPLQTLTMEHIPTLWWKYQFRLRGLIEVARGGDSAASAEEVFHRHLFVTFLEQAAIVMEEDRMKKQRVAEAKEGWDGNPYYAQETAWEMKT